MVAGQRPKRFWRRGQGRLLALVNGGGERILRRFFFRQKAVDDEELLTEADRGEFRMRARRFAQGGVLGAGDEDQAGALTSRPRPRRRLDIARAAFRDPASGPRQEASPLPASRKPLQAPGSCNRRIVWPVGAVSKMM